MNKKELRKEIKSRIEQYSQMELFRLSNKMKKSFLEHFFQYDNFFIYVNLVDEMDTKSLIKVLFNSSKKIYIPTLVDSENMIFQRITKDTELRKNKFGVIEPVLDKKLVYREDSREEDKFIYVMPCRGFDTNLNRLGRGKGYYDRYLSGLNSESEALKVCLAFDFQKVDTIYAEEFDIKMDYILTDKKLYGGK